MEVESAFRRMLLADATVNGYVTGKVYRNRLGQVLDGTSGRAVVVARNGGWATPDTVKTAEYPLLTLKCYADPTRNGGEIVRADAEDKALALYRAVDRLMHGRRGMRVGAAGSDPGLMVVSVARWKEPTVWSEKDRHGEGAGDPLGDTVYVHAEYALQVLH